MALVVGIKFRTGQKVYYFDPENKEYHAGEHVIVETVRGMEYGEVVFGNREVSGDEVVLPLKPITRLATEEDRLKNEANLAERDNLVSTTVKKVTERNLPMKIVDAEYTFDRTKVIIFFTAESRIDFRELVRDLAGAFRLRIELRQIYERDDIKLRGSLAICGRPCCCISHLQDYDKVSIKMAKVQGLSLTPGKISGCCGKLMCCLKYEYPYYQETFKMMPKINSIAMTPDGEGVVISNDLLKKEVKLKITDQDGAFTFKTYKISEINVEQAQNENEVSDDLPQDND